ncbi:MAG: Ig-like domain-containing protein, partial [Pirellulales bacterium]
SDVLENDIFPDDYAGPRRTSSASFGQLGGAVRLVDDGRAIEYQPPAGVAGTDSLVYIVDQEYVGQVKVDVDAPLADDLFDVVQHTPEQPFDLLANDPFFRGYEGERRITAVSATSAGSSVRIADDGRSVFYTAESDAQGTDKFRYLVDGQFEAVVRVQVHRPVVDDWLPVEQDSNNNRLDVLANDMYRDSQRIVHRIVDRVTQVSETEQGGIVRIAADEMAVFYTPPVDFVGTDTFSYLADGLYEARVRVQVSRPVRPDRFDVRQSSSGEVLDVLANDFWSDAYTGQRLITSVTQPELGSAAITRDGKQVVYTPEGLVTGTDRFEYTVDGLLTAAVTVRVTPLARNDWLRLPVSYRADQYVLDVLENDQFVRPYNGPGRITGVTPPDDGGTVQIINGGRALSYRPAEPTAGRARFTYVVDDRFEAEASVTIGGYLRGDSIVVVQNGDANVLDVLSNDFDPLPYNFPPYDGPEMITEVSVPENGGTVAVASNGGTVRYTPAADYVGTDRFSYTVDGVQSVTVQIRVIRFARDDRFRVDPGSQQNALRVLVNDRTDPASGSDRRITRVTDPAEGGTVVISDDGQSVRYTPAESFEGTDQFAYFLDNGNRADVTVEVTSELDNLLPRFEDQDALKQYLVDNALRQYAPLFGQEVNGAPWDPTVVRMNDSAEGLAPTSVPERSYSETNVQVAGVDEGDIIEVDSDYIYIVAEDGLVIADAWPAEELHVVSRTPIDGRPLVEYLFDDRLTVISDTTPNIWEPIFPYTESPIGRIAVDSVPGNGRIGIPPVRQDPSLTVTVFDVSDRSAPV